ncbi:MAG: hypothetical protein AAB459_01595 [Patescibacteria group bacterium]
MSPEQQELITNYLQAEGRLAPKASEDIASNAVLAEVLGQYPSTLRKLIHDINDNLGTVNNYKFGPTIAPGYTKTQQKIIATEVQRRKELSATILAVGTFAGQIGAPTRLVMKAITKLEIEPYEIPSFAKKGLAKYGLKLDQQTRIKSYLDETYFSIPEATDEIENIANLATKHGVVHATIKKCISETAEEMSEIERYRFPSGAITQGLSLRQQVILEKWLLENNLLVPEAPPDYLSAADIGRSYGDTKRALERDSKLRQAIGKVDIYRFGSRRVEGYSPKQQELIRAALKRQRNINKLGAISASDAVDHVNTSTE